MLNKIKTIYTDNSLLVIDKPAGILVHPTQAGEKDTLVDFLVTHVKGIEKLDWPDPDRLGIAHRLDKDTSGLMILAKTPDILKNLQEQFKQRKVKKNYLALVLGKIIPKDGKIEASITRSRTGPQSIQNISYSFSKQKIRKAVTLYETINIYTYQNEMLTLIKALPQTGRMHQIRVHLKHHGFPIIGDKLYCNKQSKKISKELIIDRQFLHAEKIEFKHPKSNKLMSFDSMLPKDLQNILDKLIKI